MFIIRDGKAGGQGGKYRGKFISFPLFFEVPCLVEEFLYQKKENTIEQ